MSDAQPPTDQQPGRIAGSAFIVATFGLLAVLLVGLALFYLIEGKEPFTSPRVWVALLGAVYAGGRAFMIYSKNRARNARG
ncbi:MAG: hypothetical protein WDN76_13720 [Alphaproteobacteria bacterium]